MTFAWDLKIKEIKFTNGGCGTNKVDYFVLDGAELHCCLDIMDLCFVDGRNISGVSKDILPWICSCSHGVYARPSLSFWLTEMTNILMVGISAMLLNVKDIW